MDARTHATGVGDGAKGADLTSPGKIEEIKALVKTLEDLQIVKKVDHKDDRRKPLNAISSTRWNSAKYGAAQKCSLNRRILPALVFA